MINIIIIKNNNLYFEVKINGHSQHNIIGKDIVCAGVSAIVFGTLNTLSSNAFKGKINIDKNNDSIIISDISNNNKIQTIIETMHIQLKTIEKEYNKEIKIKEE